MRVYGIFTSVIVVYFLVLFLGIFNLKIYNALFVDPVQYYHISKQQKNEEDKNKNFLYQPSQNEDIGVTINNNEKRYGNYTFLLQNLKMNPLLLDENGTVIHSWEKDLSEVWPDPNHSVHSVDPDSIYAYRSFLDEETGSVYLMLASMEYMKDNLGLVKLNKNSELMWVYDTYVHHDIAFSQDKKKIYVLTREAIYEKRPEYPHIEPPFLDESIVALDQNGNEIQRMSFMDLFSHPDYSFVIADIKSTPEDPAFSNDDIFHANTVEIIPPEADGKAPMLVEGHLMISFRNLDLLIIVDPDKEEITWASFGPWRGQHDPEVQEDGTVYMFDNMGSFKSGAGGSRVLQIDLNTMAILWEYNGTKDDPFYSRRNGSIDVLPNQNILVTESYEGRVFEVTRDKEIVWEYWNPDRITFEKSRHGRQYDGKEHIASIFSAKRYKKEDLPFLEDKE